MNPHTTWKGSAKCLLNKAHSFDPTTGWVYSYSYVGTEVEIDDAIRAIPKCSSHLTRRVENDQHFLDVTTSMPLEETEFTDSPCDVYDFSTEFAVDDIWTNPKIVALTGVTVTGDGTPGDQANEQEQVKVMARFKHFAETRKRDLYNGYVKFDDEVEGKETDKVRPGFGPTPLDKTGLYNSDGTPNADAVADFGTGDRVNAIWAIYWQYMVGQTTWESRRLVLSRRRVIPVGYATPLQIDAVERVYTTSAFKTAFSLPPDVADRLPADPPVRPTGFWWGWKIRRQDSSLISRSGRIEETVDWLFALWGDTTHEVVKPAATPP